MAKLIKTVDLIAKFQYALDNHWGYILNTWHTRWTQELQSQKIAHMKSKYGANWADNASAKKDDSYTAALYGKKWIGSWVTDCSGLFYWAFKELGGYMYHGSNTMWKKYCTAQGKLEKGARTDGKPLLPGTAVFVLKGTSDRSHVGLYIGGGKVIEASGTQAGVIFSAIDNKKWCEWGELSGVDYGSAANIAPTPSAPAPAIKSQAIVNATKVALRNGPSTNASVILRVDQGERVDLNPASEWTRVTYQGKTGYMMTKFLDIVKE